MENMDFEYISQLIYKKIVGTITQEEERQLNKWRSCSKENEQLYSKLSDMSYLQEQYYRWRMARSSDSAKKEMEMRIKKNRYSILHIFRNIAAVLFLALVFAVSYKLYRSECKYRELLARQETEQYIESIHHGETKATLKTDNGKTVVLGNNHESNAKAISSLKKEHNTNPIKHSDSTDRIAINNLEIPRGGEFHIILEDSTQVWLNAESSLTYPEHFTEECREVKIKGEAYFKVAKDSGRPFFVITEKHKIKVHGTEFNVFSYEDEPFVYTTLVSGSISLQPIENSNTELVLTPGHQAIYAKSSNSTFVEPVKTDVVTSWMQGMFVFENKTLEQIMRQLARWYDFTYSFADRKAANTVFMGKIPRYGKFGDVLEILEKSGNLRFDVVQKEIIIFHK